MRAKDLLKTNAHQILLVFTAFLAMVLVSYFYVSSIVQRQMQSLGDISMDATQSSVSASLTETEVLFSTFAQTVDGLLSADAPNKDILTYLKSTNTYFNSDRSPLPGFMKIYGYIRGEWLDGSEWIPPGDYVPQSRPWYIGADKNAGRIFFSEPYIDADSGDMCISFSQKVYDQNVNGNGILAIDLKLSRITDHVQNKEFVGNGYGVLIDDKMTFIVHRNQDMIGMKMPDGGGDYPKLADIFTHEKQLSAIRFQDTDQTDSIIFFRTVFNGWHIGLIIPRTSYYQDVYSLAATLSVLGFLLAIALSFLLFRMWMQKQQSDEESSSKSNFLARMSHEMRTPMNAIIGMTGIARASNDPARKEYCLVKISDASNHLLGVINDVLDMSKISAGKLELSETDFQLEGMLRQLEAVINYKIREKQQLFEMDLAPDVPKALVADRQRLAQVITNLLSNANKFTPQGGHISMRIRRLPNTGGNCTLEFEVEDNGIGIAKEQHHTLFQSFEQADGSISRKYGGTGLGLAISKRIVEMMGGAIRIESELGKGARFIFTILTREGKTAVEVENVEGQQSLADEQVCVFHGRKILLAEDVEINREVLIALLGGTGVQIESAENGQMACDMFAASPDAYDMIFMDIQMPEMDGYEATKRIRSMNTPKAKTIPIVAMSANVLREDIERCHAAGMDDHVGKPLELDKLIKKMRLYMNDPQ